MCSPGPYGVYACPSFTNCGPFEKDCKIHRFRELHNTDQAIRYFCRHWWQYVSLCRFRAPIVLIFEFAYCASFGFDPQGKGLFRLIICPALYYSIVVASAGFGAGCISRLRLVLSMVILGILGLPAGEFLNSPTQALPSILAVNVWVEMGIARLFFSQGFRPFPRKCPRLPETTEPNDQQVLRRITLPLLMPITFFLMDMEGIQFLRILPKSITCRCRQWWTAQFHKSAALYINQKAFNQFVEMAALAVQVLFFFLSSWL